MKMDTAASSKGNEGAESSNCHAQNGSSTPKTSEKKQKTKPIDNSDSSLTPSANKIAKASPRATRSSQNPDFAAKQRKFLNRVHDPIRRDNSDSDNSQGSATPLSAKQQKEKKSLSNEKKNISDIKRKAEKEGTPKRSAENDDEGSAKKRRVKEPTKVVGGVDSYCWRCHRDGNVIPCGACPRVYHLRCVQIEEAPSKGWMCPECSTVMKAENTDTRTKAMRMLTLDQLCSLLRYALNRMKSHDGRPGTASGVESR